MTNAGKAIQHLSNMSQIITEHPDLVSEIDPHINPVEGEMRFYTWGDNWKKLVAGTPGFPWREELDPRATHEGQVDAVARIYGVTIRVSHIRTLARSKFEDFIPRDLNPANKELTEEIGQEVSQLVNKLFSEKTK